ncbi:hypothetical protein [Streptomyces sp. 604F]|uniref:hypothetical protein n=1 Tax=Streptomyces sp. 604F TaxID=1476754 RepID=UPI001EF18BE0|nr:hypothetical protein [Streptomyces sp. 604F]
MVGVPGEVHGDQEQDPAPPDAEARRQWSSTEKIAASVSSARASAVVAVCAASTSLTSRLPA